jgi:hypothetical protein
MLGKYLLCAAALLGLAPIVRANPADIAALLQNVKELVAPGALPGPVVAFTENAFPVVTATQNGRRLPVIAAGRYERGRAIAVGHEAFFSASALKNPDNAALLLNAVRWVSRGGNNPRVVVLDDSAIAFTLSQAGCAVENLSARALSERIEAPDFDAIVLNTAAIDGPAGATLQQFLSAFLRRGGGVVASSLGWGWLQLNPGKSLATQHAGNRLLLRAGLSWADGGVEPTGPRGFVADGANGDDADSRRALRALYKHADRSAVLPENELAQAVAAVSAALAVLPGEEVWFTPRVRTLVEKYGNRTIPTAEAPVTLAAPFARLRLIVDQQAIARQQPETRAAHPAAASFPGAVDPSAPRVTRTVKLDLKRPDWQSTGLYAVPGEPIQVVLSPRDVGRGMFVRIGCHTDTLWELPSWQRFPQIAQRTAITREVTRVSSPFGGPIYLEVPQSEAAIVTDVTISGAVEAPRFVRGRTNLGDWRDALRLRPGPWAELEGRRIILSVPSETIRGLDDPEAVLAYWDEVADLTADLYGIPRERRQPERYVTDRQISAGYMHSGYPIMTGLDVAARFTDLAALRGAEGNACWGFYHELGHNHQKDAWTFEGTGEVTNNLASLYLCERLNNDKIGHPAMAPDARKKRWDAYVAGGSAFADWKKDPFLALQFYAELREAFGWGLFEKVFAAYEAAPAADLPRTDDEKRDQWLVRCSRAAGKNLAPFFVRWGIPTSESARRSLADLPAWPPPAMAPAPRPRGS